MVAMECKGGKETPAELTLEPSLDPVRGDRDDQRYVNIPTKEACAGVLQRIEFFRRNTDDKIHEPHHE